MTLARCDTCFAPVDTDFGGSVDEEGQCECEACADGRFAYELRHAGPPHPTTVEEYIDVKECRDPARFT